MPAVYFLVDKPKYTKVLQSWDTQEVRIKWYIESNHININGLASRAKDQAASTNALRVNHRGLFDHTTSERLSHLKKNEFMLSIVEEAVRRTSILLRDLDPRHLQAWAQISVLVPTQKPQDLRNEPFE